MLVFATIATAIVVGVMAYLVVRYGEDGLEMVGWSVLVLSIGGMVVCIFAMAALGGWRHDLARISVTPCQHRASVN